MEPLLLITNADAGSTDAESLEQALSVLRRHADVEVARTSNPGELDGVLQRRGGRRVVVAGGDGSMHAVVAALHRRHELDKGVLALVPLGSRWSAYFCGPSAVWTTTVWPALLPPLNFTT